MEQLEGKVAVVTGSASGIGAATARLLAGAGAAVVVADVDGAGAERVAAEVTSAGGTAVARATDVTRPDEVGRMVRTAVDHFGGLDLAVNNAGTSGAPGGILDCPPEQWQATLDLNLTSVYHCLRAEVAPMLERGGGAIVNVASVAGIMGFAALPAYAASKHGVVGLTRSVAVEMARRGVRVNAVCPSNTRTPMLEAFIGGDPAIEKMVMRGSPMGRMATPDEVAAAIVWLLSPASSYVNGVVLPVDSGAAAGG